MHNDPKSMSGQLSGKGEGVVMGPAQLDYETDGTSGEEGGGGRAGVGEG